jgi:hypothetical protein
MTGERKITYGDVMNLEKELLDAPELPKAEQSVKDKKEAISLLKKGIYCIKLFSRTKTFANSVWAGESERSNFPEMRRGFGKSFCPRV